MSNNNSRLKRFGLLILDPQTVTAVGPIYSDDDIHVRGIRVVTTGGAIDVIDDQSVEAITRWLEASIT